MLVQFALIVFALVGLLSLVVDIGYARLTQGQMQSAADSAALEGLRNLNVTDKAFQSDCFRRAAANLIVRRTFEDDMDPSNGDPDYQFGAGPVLDLTEGVTSVHALQTITVPDTHVYKPAPQLNQQNAVYGDMVSGRFCYTADPVPSEGGTYELQDLVCEQAQQGSGIYSRNDFNPNPTPPPPSANLTQCPAAEEAVAPPPPIPGPAVPADVGGNSAFLVRLRRSNEFQGLPDQTESDVGSSGPSLPLTFGKGTTIHGDDPNSDYSVRRDGLTVRATAISTARRAMRVGLPQPLPGQPGVPRMPGVTPFALVDTCVQNLNTNGYPVVINPANGLIMSSTTGCTGAGTMPATLVVGRLVDNPVVPTPSVPALTRWMAISTIGQPFPAPFPPVAVPCASVNLYNQSHNAALGFTGYGPVYSVILGTSRIIGFTRITLRPNPAPPLNPCAMLISRSPSVVAPSNATAVLAGGLSLPVGVPPAAITQLLNRYATFAYGPVLVPVLAR